MYLQVVLYMINVVYCLANDGYFSERICKHCNVFASAKYLREIKFLV